MSSSKFVFIMTSVAAGWTASMVLASLLGRSGHQVVGTAVMIIGWLTVMLSFRYCITKSLRVSDEE